MTSGKRHRERWTEKWILKETERQTKKAEKKMFTINVSKKMKEERNNETHIQVYRGLLGKDRRKSG
jgi:hypothetical protein